MKRTVLARYELSGTQTTIYTVQVPEDQVGDFHQHPGYSTVVVLEGACIYEDGTQDIALHMGQKVVEQRSTFHRITGGPFGCKLLVIISHLIGQPTMVDSNGNRVNI